MAKKVPKKRKVPLRTCIGCSEAKPKRELLRVVRTPEKEIVVDKSGKMNGRGTYVCYSKSCAETALSKNKVNYALDIVLDENELEKIKKDILLIIEETVEVS